MPKTSNKHSPFYTADKAAVTVQPIHSALVLVYHERLPEPAIAISSRLLPWQSLSYQTRATRAKRLPKQLPELTTYELGKLQMAEVALLRKRQIIFLRVTALAAMVVNKQLTDFQRAAFLRLLDQHTRPCSQDYWQGYHSDLYRELHKLGATELVTKLAASKQLAQAASQYAKAMLPEVPDFMLSPIC